MQLYELKIITYYSHIKSYFIVFITQEPRFCESILFFLLCKDLDNTVFVKKLFLCKLEHQIV